MRSPRIMALACAPRHTRTRRAPALARSVQLLTRDLPRAPQYRDKRDRKESVAWKDFCEDLQDAHKHARPGSPEHDSAQQARGKGHIPGRGELPPAVKGWQPAPSKK